MGVTELLNSPAGRVARGLLGVILLIVGLGVIHGAAGGLLALGALAILGAALFDACFLAGLRGCCASGGRA